MQGCFQHTVGKNGQTHLLGYMNPDICLFQSQCLMIQFYLHSMYLVLTDITEDTIYYNKVSLNTDIIVPACITQNHEKTNRLRLCFFFRL